MNQIDNVNKFLKTLDKPYNSVIVDTLYEEPVKGSISALLLFGSWFPFKVDILEKENYKFLKSVKFQRNENYYNSSLIDMLINVFIKNNRQFTEKACLQLMNQFPIELSNLLNFNKNKKFDDIEKLLNELIVSERIKVLNKPC